MVGADRRRAACRRRRRGRRVLLRHRLDRAPLASQQRRNRKTDRQTEIGATNETGATEPDRRAESKRATVETDTASDGTAETYATDPAGVATASAPDRAHGKTDYRATATAVCAYGKTRRAATAATRPTSKTDGTTAPGTTDRKTRSPVATASDQHKKIKRKRKQPRKIPRLKSFKKKSVK